MRSDTPPVSEMCTLVAQERLGAIAQLGERLDRTQVDPLQHTPAGSGKPSAEQVVHASAEGSARNAAEAADAPSMPRRVRFEGAPGVPPYPQFCRHPDRCAGLFSCPRDPVCID